jgi:hypothetical protein
MTFFPEGHNRFFGSLALPAYRTATLSRGRGTAPLPAVRHSKRSAFPLVPARCLALAFASALRQMMATGQ